MALPLFLGMSKADIDDMLANYKIGYHAVPDAKIIAESGSPCANLTLIADGNVRVVASPDDWEYAVEERIASPCAVQPECIFGLMQRYTRTFYASGPCTIVSIERQDVVRISDNYQIFRINLLNLISTQSQKLSRLPWRQTGSTLRQRICQFVEARCLSPYGAKKISIKMTRLAEELNESRRKVSEELHQMADEGLLTLRREAIFIDALERLSDQCNR